MRVIKVHLSFWFQAWWVALYDLSQASDLNPDSHSDFFFPHPDPTPEWSQDSISINFDLNTHSIPALTLKPKVRAQVSLL